jgi:hypothetical protein
MPPTELAILVPVIFISLQGSYSLGKILTGNTATPEIREASFTTEQGRKHKRPLRVLDQGGLVAVCSLTHAARFKTPLANSLEHLAVGDAAVLLKHRGWGIPSVPNHADDNRCPKVEGLEENLLERG